KYICIHGHFYQPPRENPWLNKVEIQDSAYPFHDWNHRINAECYIRNSSSRVLNGDGQIESIMNNYGWMSYNIGPTLLAWMEQEAPETYQGILEADKESQERFSGHGAALAQAFNHMIMPDRKSTRLNSSHVKISYAVYCLKKKRIAMDPSNDLSEKMM